MLRVAACAALVVLAWALGSSPVRAQTPEEKETARALMEAGQRRLAERDLLGALEAFQNADEIMKVPTTGLARGQVLERLGRLTEAVDVLRRVARHPVAPDEPQAFVNARNEATKLDLAIAARIPSLSIQVTGPPTGTVKLEIDGRALDDAAVGLPLRLDPGQHRVRISAPGYLPQIRSVELAAGAAERLEVFLEVDPHASTEPPPPPPLGVEPTPADAFTVPTVAIVSFALAGAGLVVGAITGGLSLAKVSELEEACGGRRDACPTHLKGDHQGMLVLANVSNVSFALAGAATLVGFVTLFTLQEDDESAAVTGVISPMGAGLVGRF
jgi:hypothetical protein